MKILKDQWILMNVKNKSLFVIISIEEDPARTLYDGEINIFKKKENKVFYTKDHIVNRKRSIKVSK